MTLDKSFFTLYLYTENFWLYQNFTPYSWNNQTKKATPTALNHSGLKTQTHKHTAMELPLATSNFSLGGMEVNVDAMPAIHPSQLVVTA